MTRRDWWIGILVLVAAIVAHGAMHRYSWHLYAIDGQGKNARALVRIDRFTGAITHEPVPRLDLDALYGLDPIPWGCCEGASFANRDSSAGR
jgi:hypothetical protein